MTRTEKVKKLTNAVREYRGMYHAKSKKWIHAPKASAGVRVRAWLEKLGVDVTEGMKRVDGFQSFDEFAAWVRAL